MPVPQTIGVSLIAFCTVTSDGITSVGRAIAATKAVRSTEGDKGLGLWDRLPSPALQLIEHGLDPLNPGGEVVNLLEVL